MSDLLHVGAPPIVRAPYGRGVLVDFGGILPEVFPTFHVAATEVAARTSVPPAGSYGSTRTPVNATPGWAGSEPTVAAPPAAGGWAPELSASASPRGAGSGAPEAFPPPEVVGVPTVVGAGTPTSGSAA